MMNQQSINDVEEQLNLELQASQMYLQMSIWCDINNFKGFATYFTKQSNEEREHAFMVKEYGVELVGSIPINYVLQLHNEFNDRNEWHFSSLLQIMQQALSAEQEVTKSIETKISNAANNNDYGTCDFFRSMIKEQIRSMSEINYVIDKIKQSENDTAAIFELDKEVSEL